MAGDPGVDVPQFLPQRVQFLDDFGRQDVLVPILVRKYSYRVMTNLKSVSYAFLNQAGNLSNGIAAVTCKKRHLRKIIYLNLTFWSFWVLKILKSNLLNGSASGLTNWHIFLRKDGTDQNLNPSELNHHYPVNV